MQDNQLHDFLTVKETMTFAWSFKNKNSREKLKVVEDILSSLGMNDKIETSVQHLSGGEKKRLSIAVELVDDPLILFLDEPTTGLDASSSTQCVKLLKKLSMEGKTIICTIHSPSAMIFEMFDHIYALADGCCIYQGSSENLVPFLSDLNLICPETHSPCDFLLEVATNDYGPQNHRLTEKIKNGSENKYATLKSQNLPPVDLPSPSRSIYQLSFVAQTRNLLHRKFLIVKRDKMLLTLRLTIHVAMAIVFGSFYADVGREASKFFDNYRYIITTVVVQLYTSYFSMQTASESFIESSTLRPY